MDTLFFLLFLAVVVACVVYAVDRVSKFERKQMEEELRELRKLSMSYLHNHIGSAVGLSEFLYQNYFRKPIMTPEEIGKALAAANREAELALTQYHEENPLDVEIPREPSFKRPPDRK